VGDSLNYTVQVIHDRDLEFTVDHLKRENLSLSPFALRGITVRRGEWGENKRLLEITLTLTSYETGKSELTIPPFYLYYFLREAGMGRKESQAEAVQIRGAKVGLRSTLIAGQLKHRDFKPLSPIDWGRGMAALFLGLAGMTFLAFRSVRWAWILLHRERPTRRRLSRRAREGLVQESLASIRRTLRESPEDPVRLSAEVSQFLRQYATQWLGIEAAGLTPEEIESALRQAGANSSVAEQIRAILEQCDGLRYAKDGLRLRAEQQKDLLEALERVVTPPRI
jgi:hypothetical protein